MKTRERIIARIERFLTETGMTAREFGLQSVGDHKFVARLKQGTVTLSRIERAEAFIGAYKPRPQSPRGSSGIAHAAE